MKIREAFEKAFGFKRKSSSSSSSSTTKIVPRYPEKKDVVYFNPNVHKEEPTNAQKAEDEIKCYVDPITITKKEPTKPVDLVYDEKCDPKTCWGECEGKGWCEIAQEWQKRIHHNTYFNKAVVQVFKRTQKKKNKKNRKKTDYRAKKAKWIKNHNRKKRR